MGEPVDTIEGRGWGFTTQSFAVKKADGRVFTVTLDKSMSLALGKMLINRASKMED